MNPSRLITPVLRVLLVLFAAGPALAETSEPFTNTMVPFAMMYALHLESGVHQTRRELEVR